MAANYTEGLAEFIATTRFEDIPRPVVEHAKLLVLDALGCGILGAKLPWSVVLRGALQELEAPGDALVWGTTLRLSAPNAAMANATSVHGFEIDDVGAGGHNGSVVLTTGLALGEHRGGLSGKDLITAAVVGIETASRVGNSVGNVPHVTVGFHGPGVMGTFAATASGCQVLGLETQQVVSALGHAGQQAGGLMATSHGGMGKRLLAGKAAHSGTLAAVLASRGFTNVNNIFECEYGGFCSAFSGARDTYKLEELTRDLGTAWNTPRANFKMWACRVPIHPALEALRDIRRAHGLTADQVEHIRVWLSEGSIKAVGWPWVPTTITSAQLNLQYCAAVYLLEDAVFVEQFHEDKLAHPSVMDLTGRIEILPDVAGADRGVFHQFVRVEVATKEGQVWTADGVTRGTAGRPISREDVVEKFRRLVSPDLSPALQDAMIDACNHLESMADATSLTQYLGA